MATTKVFKALYKFEAAEKDELDLQPGDFIEVVLEHKGEWGFGTHQRTRKQGSFPWSYVKHVPGARPQPEAVRASNSPRSSPRSAQPSQGGRAPPHVMRSKKPHEAIEAKAAVKGYENMPVGGFGTAPTGTEPFANEPWYAGPMDREAAKEAMVGKKDGTFLIRRSTNHDGYSLSVIYSDCRHMKICKINGQFGLVEEQLFESMPELVKHFEKISLECYNAELETVLEFPFKTAPDAPVGYRDDEPDEDIYMSNKSELIQSYAKKTEKTFSDIQNYTAEVKRLQKDQRAQKQVLAFYREQKTLLEGKDSRNMQKNLTMLKMRLVDAERNLHEISNKLKQKIADEDQGRESQESHQTNEPVYSAYSSVRMRSLAEIPPVPEESKSHFYCGEQTRDEGEALLKKQKDGTYLIRKSNRTVDPYTLSVRHLNVTKHVQIKYDGTRFGLAAPLAFYSLEGLCEYYKTTELSPSIKVKLIKPLKERTSTR